MSPRTRWPISCSVTGGLTALYAFCDDHLTPPERTRPGQRNKLSDAELICLAVAQVLLGFPSQHHWLRFAYGRLGHLFRGACRTSPVITGGWSRPRR